MLTCINTWIDARHRVARWPARSVPADFYRLVIVRDNIITILYGTRTR